MTDQSFFPSAKNTRREQVQCMADRLVEVRRLMREVERSPGLAARMEEQGFGPDELIQGQALYRAARSALIARQAAMARLHHATEQFDEAQTNAHQIYLEFRSLARFLFKDAYTRLALGLEAKIPDDLQKFVILARSSYRTALKNPSFRVNLSRYGSIEVANQSLAKLVEAERELEQARTAAGVETDHWDRRMVELDAWANQFCKAIKIVRSERSAVESMPEFETTFSTI